MISQIIADRLFKWYITLCCTLDGTVLAPYFRICPLIVISFALVAGIFPIAIGTQLFYFLIACCRDS